MSTLEVAITPHVIVFAPTEGFPGTDGLLAFLNESTDAPETIKWHRPWRVDKTDQEFGDTIVFLIGDAARWDLSGDEWDDYDSEEVANNLEIDFRYIPEPWEFSDISVDAEDM